MKWLFISLFTAITTIHLYASLKKDDKLRAITKPFILLSLIGLYIFGATSLRWEIVTALILSWIGDILLIPSGDKWFTAGGTSFMLSHVFYMLGYSHDINFAGNPVYSFVIPVVIFLIAVTITLLKLKIHLPKGMFFPMYFYLLINGLMNCFAAFRMISYANVKTVTTCIGALLFFISDVILFFVRFNKECKIQTQFSVMLTYSIGEFMIVLGLI